MDKLQEFMEQLPDKVIAICSRQDAWREATEYFARAENEIRHFKKYGTFKISPATSIGDTAARGSKLSTQQRTKREVLNENLTENVLQVKLERISEIPAKRDIVEDAENRESIKENIKIEKPDMPPPQMPVKKNRKIKTENSVGSVRSTRSKASKKDISTDNHQNRESDIIFEKAKIETIILLESDDESDTDSKKGSLQSTCSSTDNEENMRTTRTKTRNKKQNNDDTGKRNRSPSTDIENKTKPSKAPRQTKRQKSGESLPPKETSVYEDAQSSLVISQKPQITNDTYTNTEMDKTYVTRKEDKPSTSQLDKTHTVEKDIPERVISNETIRISDPKVVKSGPLNIKDIMTDDEDDDNVVVTLPKKTTKSVKTGAKAIFSPFSGSPVKKRVEAFEKLNTPKIPIRTTRTNTKPKQNKEDDKLHETGASNKSEKNVTPKIATRYLTTLSNSTSKVSKKLINESYVSTKSSSALKATQQEFRDRENRRREKEAEALRKREALILAQTEEKKKKRLEKQMKAQQTREALEQCKLKNLEQVEKTKDEKVKQILAEKEERLRKRKEEERKKAAEEDKRRAAEEERKKAAQEELEKIKKMEMKKALEEERRRANYNKRTFVLPIYLRQKAPLLPTEDCYDSDDENQRKQIRKPSWTSRERLASQLKIMNDVDKEIVSNFFILDVITPDLRDIFEYIDPRKLKRTSSANWKVPPRFTLMPTDTIEEDGEEE